MKFVIITPVRNEERYVATTIKCMIAQTLLPIEWIIVDDGSTDNTQKIIKNSIGKNSFIKYLYRSDRGYRKPGQGVVETFYEGFQNITYKDYEIIAKFDADLDFPPNFLEKISDAFVKNPELGITGGTRYESSGKNSCLHKVIVPRGFVGGPYKFYRRKCFEDINGLVSRAGWDGVDTIKANMLGWQTGELEDLKIIHLKPTGFAKGEGLANSCLKDGDINYYMGGYIWYFFLRVIGRSLQARNGKIGYYMLKGYFKSWSLGIKRESDEFRTYLKKVQLNNIVYFFKLALRM